MSLIPSIILSLWIWWWLILTLGKGARSQKCLACIAITRATPHDNDEWRCLNFYGSKKYNFQPSNLWTHLFVIWSFQFAPVWPTVGCSPWRCKVLGQRSHQWLRRGKGLVKKFIKHMIGCWLLAPQSGALIISAYRDFLPYPIPIPLIAFEHLSLSMVIWDSASRPRQINVDQAWPKQVSILRFLF